MQTIARLMRSAQRWSSLSNADCLGQQRSAHNKSIPHRDAAVQGLDSTNLIDCCDFEFSTHPAHLDQARGQSVGSREAPASFRSARRPDREFGEGGWPHTRVLVLTCGN